jgi:hypothetical protein
MKFQSLIYRSADFFGIAYYGFLALYSLYELFIGGSYPALLVVSPLIYALGILGILRIILSALYAISALRKWRKELLREAAWHFAIGHISFGITIVLVLYYVSPDDWESLIEPSAWFFISFAVADVLLRIMFYQPAEDTAKDAWIARLRQASSSYPIGSIALAILMIGAYILISLFSFRLDLGAANTIFGILLVYSIFTFIYDNLNRMLGEFVITRLPDSASDPSRFQTPRPEPEGGVLSFLISISFQIGSVIFLMESLFKKWFSRYSHKSVTGNLASKQPPQNKTQRWQSILSWRDPGPHRWSHGVTLMLAILSTVLSFLVIGMFLDNASIIRLFIFSFSGIYGFLAWIRWCEIKELGKQTLEINS